MIMGDPSTIWLEISSAGMAECNDSTRAGCSVGISIFRHQRAFKTRNYLTVNAAFVDFGSLFECAVNVIWNIIYS
jgi:hypothetical protein